MKSAFPLLLLIVLLTACAGSRIRTEESIYTPPKQFEQKKQQGKASKKASTRPKVVLKDIAEPAEKTIAPAKTNVVQKAPVAQKGPIITPSQEFLGQVAMVNRSARFAVLLFPIGEVPPAGKELGVYRGENKVAELRVTGPQRENNTVADILSGEPEVSDEVR